MYRTFVLSYKKSTRQSRFWNAYQAGEMEDAMTAEQLSAIAGAILSLVFSYVPGIYKKYQPLSEEIKRLIMLGLLVLTCIGIYALACTKWGAYLGITVTCDQPGLVQLIWSLVLAIMANQSTYRLSPRVGGFNRTLHPARN
jgi:hypothetical protein